MLTVYGTEWPILCWCAVKKLLTYSLVSYVIWTQKYNRPVAYLGQAVVVVVDLTGRVRVGQVPRREVVQGEVDALARLSGQFYGARRHGVCQGVETGRRWRGRRLAVSKHRYSTAAAAAAACRPVTMTTLRHHATDVAKVSRHRLPPGLQALVVIRQDRCTIQYSTSYTSCSEKSSKFTAQDWRVASLVFLITEPERIKLEHKL